MINAVFYVNGEEWKRVQKARARHEYNAGKEVVLCPCELRPFGPWHPEVMISKEHCLEEFETVVLNYEWYNCKDGCGKYAAYYVRG